MSTHDVIIVGLGAMGSAAAAELGARGQRVLGLERFQPGHDRGSSHGQSRIIRQAYLEGAFYVPMLLRAYELWERLERDTGRHLMHLDGGLFIGRPDSRVVADTLAAAREHELPVETLDHDEIRARYPALRPAADHIGVLEPRMGSLRPEEAIAALLDVAAGHGADLRFSAAVERLEVSAAGDGVVVESTTGRHAADKLILTAGAWSPGLLEGLGYAVPMQVERLVLHWFHPGADLEPFRPARFPVNLWEIGDGAIMYGFPLLGAASDGVKYAFHNRQRTPCDPDRVNREVSASEIAEIAECLARYVPSLGREHLRSKTCLYTTTPDERFVIGRHPLHRQIFVAAGFSGHGFKFAPVVGEILAELVCDGTSRLDIAAFAPERF